MAAHGVWMASLMRDLVVNAEALARAVIRLVVRKSAAASDVAVPASLAGLPWALRAVLYRAVVGEVLRAGRRLAGASAALDGVRNAAGRAIR